MKIDGTEGDEICSEKFTSHIFGRAHGPDPIVT